MKTPCPVVFSAVQVFDILREQGKHVVPGERDSNDVIASMINALAAAQWQAYVEGLTEVLRQELNDGEDFHEWVPREFVQNPDFKFTRVTRILPPEEIGK